MGAACVVVLVAVWTWAAPAPPPPLSLPQKLAQRVKFDGIQDPKISLAEALDKLGKQYDIVFDINDRAFKFEQIMDVGKTEVVGSSPIPAMKNVRLTSVLNKILSSIPVPSGAAFLVRTDHVEITTNTYLASEIWGKYTGPHLPLVNATLAKTPLEEAIKELAEQAEFNIVLDNRAADKAKTPVTITLRNTPLDTALRLLADMADLRAVHLDNVLYLTTRENAAALEARLEKERTPTNPLDDASDSGEFKPRKGTGPRSAPPQAEPGAA
jgi:hypothetical protein